MDLGITSPILPPEIINLIVYKYGGLRTPSASVITLRLLEYEEHRLEILEGGAYTEIDKIYVFNWIYFAMNYSKNKYNLLSIYK